MKLATLTLSLALAVSVPSYAYAYELNDGTYLAKFPQGCGELKITKGGKKINYKYGPCGRASTYSHSGKFDGTTIKIQSATFVITSLSQKRISGVWTLGNYSDNIRFNKK